MTDRSKIKRPEVDFGVHILPPEDGGGAETLEVSQHILERCRSTAAVWHQEIVNAEIVMADWRNAILKQAGGANWKKFIAYSKKQRQNRFDMKDFSHDSDGLARLALARRAAREKSLNILKTAKLQPGALKEINHRFAREIADLLRPKEPMIQRLESLSEGEARRAAIKRRDNPWTTRRPPFDGNDWTCSWNRFGGGDVPELVNYSDLASGGVGHRSEYGNLDAGDIDFFSLAFDTSVGVWYRPPHAGRVDIWIKARCANTGYSIWLDDEWGWSDSDTRMRSYITVNVSPGLVDETRSQSWEAHYMGNPDSRTYASDACAPNSVRWFHLVSDPIPSDVWTYIRVGTCDRHTSFLNDVSVRSVMRNWWHIEEIRFNVI